jgi:hypothetical protein
MSFARHLISPLNNTQPNSGASVSNVESMFTQIMEVVLKSVSAPCPRAPSSRHDPIDALLSLQRAEIAELRQECTELRQANLSLERQVREGIISTVCPPSSHRPVTITDR